MPGELAAAMVSITPTRRGRFFWAVWSSAAPSRVPFRKPDLSGGGAASHDEAMREAARASGRTVTEIDPRWARGWSRILRGQVPFTEAEARALDGGVDPRVTSSRKVEESPAVQSVWSVLGLEPGATPDEIKRAFRQRAFETHPDRGGSDDAFRAVFEAHRKALARAQKETRRPAKRRANPPKS